LINEYRDRIYIRKDIILKLIEVGELNRTKLLSYCGLNMTKHNEILDDLQSKGFIEKFAVEWGTKSMTKYRATEKGRQFSKIILEPYEEMFPRKGDNVS
jgi:predicted transcriptional regulator